MNAWVLSGRGLGFYWRTNLAVVLGVAVASTVLVGALFVGDSVRHTLHEQARARTGRVTFAVDAGDRFVRSALADRMRQRLGNPVAPVLRLPGVATRPDAGARANRIQVLGIDEDFWRLAPGRIDGVDLGGNQVALNTSLAAQLGVEEGGTIVLLVEKPGALPRDVPLATVEDTLIAWRLEVKAIVSPDQFGRFDLQARPAASFNAFVRRDALARRLARPPSANLLLVGEAEGNVIRRNDVEESLAGDLTIADLELNFRSLDASDGIELYTDRIFLDDAVVRAAVSAIPSATAVLTYFVNQLRLGERSTPYSMVSAIGQLPDHGESMAGLLPADMADDEILINRWLANDLSAVAGDAVTLTYFVLGPGRRLVEQSSRFKVRAIEAIEGLAADRQLMPNFPGLSDADHCREWEPGIPVDLTRIRDQDEAYWDAYRGTPKAFVTLDAGRRMWQSAYGSLTALRFQVEEGMERRVAASIVAGIDAEELGFRFLNVRDDAGLATAPMVDFGQLFLGMSFFLIVAALLLTGMLFVFGVEQRRHEIGTLRALGFGPGRIRILLLREGAVLAVVGAGVGVLGGLFFTRVVLYGLGTHWRGAVGGATLRFDARLSSAIVGALAAAVAAVLAMVWAFGRQARLPVHQLLMAERPLRLSCGQSWRKMSIPAVLGLLALSAATVLLLTVDAGRGREAAGVFFGAGGFLLVTGLAACVIILQWSDRDQGSAPGRMALGSLGMRNTLRRSGQSLATIALLACGCFLVIAINANRLDPLAGATDRGSGTGGFALYGESSLPVVRDLNRDEDRDALGLSAEVMEQVTVVPMRVRGGDDASCLNLGRVGRPRLVAVDLDQLAGREAFTFVRTTEDEPAAVPWKLLACAPDDPVVPAVADHATVAWALKMNLGQSLTYVDDRGQSFQVRIVGELADSILQGNLIIDRAAFEHRFTSQAGFRMFLCDVRGNRLDAVAAELSRGLADYGLEIMPTTRRLGAFLDVQNTYLSIFQGLGGLGLLLGSAGLGMVVVRNVLERRGEFALLRAVGFSRAHLRWMTFSEHTLLLLLGLAAGVLSALVAVIPVLRMPGTNMPLGLLMGTLLAILLSGVAWVWLATCAALRGPLLVALRNE